MYKPRKILLDRFEKFISDEYFTDVNLLSKVYPQQIDIDHRDIYYYSVPNLARAPPKDIISRSDELFVNTLDKRSEGLVFGPSWSTHWFKLNITIPDSFDGQEVHLIWDSDNEALIFNTMGVPVQGLTGGNYQHRHHYVISRADETRGGSQIILYIEMACNGLFGVGRDGLINAPDPNRTFTLKKYKIATIDQEAYNLLMDFKVISEMAKHLPEDSNRGSQALQCARDIIDACDTQDRTTWNKAKAIANDFLKQENGSSQHTIICTGHCHIDVAWLWPYDETRRKCGRSWASQCEYMDTNPDYIFAQSQAQLYDWVKHDYPELFEKIKSYVGKGQFLPVGGTWVEMDGIIPSSESMVRQFLHGQRFFKKEFGKYCTEFWLPDSFGYSGQLPQIMLGAGIEAFVTQKLSWNLINKFPNSTFMWEGLDGSKVISHFPPADTYCGVLNVEQLLFTVNNAQNKEKMNYSLALYGHGDGGGGPTPDMLDRVRICSNVDGLPKVKFGTPKQFFDVCRDVHETKGGLNTWRGELYLEMHRGTFTSQASTKKGNRKGECLLRDIETFSMLAHIINGYKYPTDQLDKLWKLLLLNQFHDVLPGSSIGLVYEDALEYYREIRDLGVQLRQQAVESLITSSSSNSSSGTITVFNSMSWERTEVAELPSNVTSGVQKSHTGSYLAIVSSPSIGYRSQTTQTSSNLQLSVQENNERIVIENSFLSATICKKRGTLTVFDKRANRIAVQDGNNFAMYDDVPLFWDAWDVEFYHLDKPLRVGLPSEIQVVESGPLRVAVRVVTPITSTSTITQYIYLTSISPRIDFNTHVSWKEAHKFLKAQFPTTVRSNHATYEVQFGHLQRPTHRNTSWDWAQFEVHAQKWADLSEFNYGVSLLNDCKYGYSCFENVLNISLLRAPKSPDDRCDMGEHQFTYSLLPHVGSLQSSRVIQESYNLNNPLLITGYNNNSNNNSASEKFGSEFSLISISHPNVIVEAMKKAEDSNRLIVRLYEAYGGHVSNVDLISNDVPFKSVQLCNLLEEEVREEDTIPHQQQQRHMSSTRVHHHQGKDTTGDIRISSMRPFEIVSLSIDVDDK